jgi:hypothetical protein
MTAVVVLGQPYGGSELVAGVLAEAGLPYGIQPSGEPDFVDLALRSVGPRRRAAGIEERETLWGPRSWIHHDPDAVDTFNEWRIYLRSDLDTRWIIIMRDSQTIAQLAEQRDGQNYFGALHRAERRQRRLKLALELVSHRRTMWVDVDRTTRDQMRNLLAEHLGIDP